VSLGCPKALVDSERIITKLRAEGYQLSPDYAGADVVVVNTCGFLDSAKAESLEAIGEAMAKNGRVIVTGCLGVEKERIFAAHPGVLAVTGPHQYEQVVAAVHEAVPPLHDPFLDLVPPEGLRLTPRHYAYLKISEGCNNRCSFCIIPQLRGKLASRPANHVMAEAERLVKAGVKELLVISQDTSAYGLDIVCRERVEGPAAGGALCGLVRGAGLAGGVRGCTTSIPYPHVDAVLPLMAEGKILPLSRHSLQHASPRVLRHAAAGAPGEDAGTPGALAPDLPDLAIRSTFIVRLPGETERTSRAAAGVAEGGEARAGGLLQVRGGAGAAANDIGAAVRRR
jgi:ribosomal protein S12 methylthiotransferase